MSQPRHIRVPPDQAGIRLDVLIGRELGIGRAQVKKALEGGQVRLDGRRVNLKHKGDFLDAGAVVEISGATRPEDLLILPRPDLSLTILAEGDGWLVVDKPSGMPVHPLEPAETNTILNFVAHRSPQVQGVGEGGLRSGVVHRLDVDTSGVLAVAIRQDVWDRLRDAFSQHQTRKSYRAIVRGHLTGEGEETMTLVVAQHRPAKVRVVAPDDTKPAGARRCHLTWRALETLRDATLIEVDLGTGFLHQIRVMMAALGHPVLGDPLYGSADGLPRQMLHASALQIADITAYSPDPDDFQLARRTLRVARP